LGVTDFVPTGGVPAKTGIYALEDADIFTLLILPNYSPNEGTTPLDLSVVNVLQKALTYCQTRRAMLLVDPPTAWTTKDKAYADLTQSGGSTIDPVRDPNSVLYFPRIEISDPLLNNQARSFSPSATMAGVMASIDVSRGVWKAPAGEEATLSGVQSLDYNVTNLQQGDLNPLAINCIRTFPIIGTVAWGARTLAGADAEASQWKYVPVRRLALFMEESLYRGTQWVVFEPNDEPLWSQIRLNVGSFMSSLFRQGAFQGSTPQQAYFVKCDSDTTTQSDIDQGVVNILVGFAPLLPAEFVVLKISQIVGNLSS
jgi:phage tail sheath protein FI